MIVGIGIDLVRIERIRQSVLRWNKRFLDRVFTPGEQSYALSARHPHPHLAAGFAVKEAVVKAIGTGLRDGMKWTEIELTHEPSGRPRVQVYGKVKTQVQALGADEMQVSVSHDSEYAIGQVMLINREK
jgi:holo-[acyl-carrier protein] synthase